MLLSGRPLHVLFAIWIALAIIATGAPLAEIHAHDGDHETSQGTPAAPADDLKTQQDPSQHLHEEGLFANAPGAAAPEHGLKIPDRAAGHFADLAVPDPRSHHSPPLRPPAR